MIKKFNFSFITDKKKRNKLIASVLIASSILGTIGYCGYDMMQTQNELTAKITDLENYTQYIKKDIDTYRYLYVESNKENTQLKKDIEVTSNELNHLKEEVALANNPNNTPNRGSFGNKDLRTNFAITANQLNEWIAQRAPKDSPFIGRGDVFIKASKKSGLDPKYLVAHAALESTWGKSNIAKEKHNYFGINAQNADPSKAYHLGDGLENGIVNGAVWIADHYTNQGQSSINSMIYGKKAYCQNDDGSPRQSWIDQILNIVCKK